MEIKGKMLEILMKSQVLKAALPSVTAVLGLGCIKEERREYRIVNGKTQYRDCVTIYSDDSKNDVDYIYGSWTDS